MTDESQEHATRSPSGSHRWRRCAGSINAERGLPDKVGIEAAEGTLFHEHAEICLRDGLEPHDLPTGEKREVSGHIVAYNQEMIDNMYAGLDWIRERLSSEALLYVETRVWIEPYTLEDNGFGTSDVAIVYVKRRKIIIFDWKYGKVPVSPFRNDQATLYTLGVWETIAGELFDWDPTGIEVEIMIWQPRVPGAGGSWETTMEEVLAEGDQIRIDAAATYDPDAPRTAGLKQCMYCKARAKCPERAAYNLELFDLHFEDIDEAIEWGPDVIPPIMPVLEEWTPERRSYVWLHRKSFTRWLQELHDAIMLDAMADKETPFVKVVQGNAGRRAYKDEGKAKTVLVKELGAKVAVIESLITPAVAEKKLGKKKYRERLAEYVTQPEGKPLLVPVTDTRDKLPSKMIHFEEVEELDEEEE